MNIFWKYIISKFVDVERNSFNGHLISDFKILFENSETVGQIFSVTGYNTSFNLCLVSRLL